MAGSSRTRLVGVVVVGFSLLFLAVGGYLVYEQERALRSFESTEATVVGTEIDRDVDREVGESDSVTYRPIVEYRYTVDGREYTAGNVYPGGTSARSDRGWAEGVVSDYSRGETVTAYYDPSDPSEAYLVRERDLTKFAFVLLPLVFLGVGLLLVWRAGWSGGDPTPAPTDTPPSTGADTPESATGEPPAQGDDPERATETGTAGGDTTAGDGEGDGVEYADWGEDGGE